MKELVISFKKANKNMDFARQKYFDEFFIIELILTKLLINLSTSYKYFFQNHSYVL